MAIVLLPSHRFPMSLFSEVDVCLKDGERHHALAIDRQSCVVWRSS